MACGTNIVPGFDDSNKIKDPGLEAKVLQLINSKPKRKKVVKKPKP